MTKYFFNVRTRLGYAADFEGMDLIDLRAAVTEAQQSALELAADMLVRGVPLDGEQFEISDDVGTHLMTVRWIDAVEFEDVYLP